MAFDSATWQRERVARRKAAGICLRCPSKTDGVHVLCDGCKPVAVVATSTSVRRILKTGRCRRCGEKKSNKAQTCNLCLAKARAWAKTFYQIPDVKDRKNNYKRKRCSEDLNFKLSENLRSRLFSAMRYGYKSGSAVRDLGCDIETFKFYLESKFKSGMTWENYGSLWHIDHMVPLSHFNLSDRKQLLKACNFKNLQPLWAKENFAKGSKILESPMEIQHAVH